MSAIAYVDGAYRRASEPLLCVEDRGFQFGDGVYEVWRVRAGRLVDQSLHFARLWRSLNELRIAAPMGEAELCLVIAETARRNHVRDGLAYLQISRGVSRRDHAFPPASVRPTLVVTVRGFDFAALDARIVAGVKVVTMRDERWARCDIKSVNLLANVLAKQAAREAGAAEAWLVDGEGMITEGASTTAWIVDAEGRLRTRALSHAILPGVTRAALLSITAERQIHVVQQAFSVEEAYGAREAFVTSALNPLVPVVAIDGRVIGDGRPGPLAGRLRVAYLDAITKETALSPRRGWRRVRRSL